MLLRGCTLNIIIFRITLYNFLKLAKLTCILTVKILIEMLVSQCSRWEVKPSCMSMSPKQPRASTG